MVSIVYRVWVQIPPRKKLSASVSGYFKGNLNRVSAAAKFSDHEYHLRMSLNCIILAQSTATSLAALIALCSILLAKPVQEQMVVLGSMTLGGVINPVQDLAASLQLAFDSGAKRFCCRCPRLWIFQRFRQSYLPSFR